jgi:NADH:ubiquinone oxidoreductase subunit 6 (subunit J)
LIASPLFGAEPQPWQELLPPLVLPLLSGALAIYMLLPRPRPYPTWIGVLLGVVALATTALSVIWLDFFSAETFLFYAFSALAIFGGSLLATQHNPARAALSFALVVLSTAGLFLLLAAPFLMAASIIIYAGAIIVIFLFVLMLAQQEGHSDADDRSREPLLVALTGFVLLGVISYLINLSFGTRGIDRLLAETRKAIALGDDDLKNKEKLSAKDLLFEPFRKLFQEYNLTDLERRLQDEVESEWFRHLNRAGSEGKLRDLLGTLERIGNQAKARLGTTQPQGVLSRLMSDKSGPPSVLGTEPLTRDDSENALRRIRRDDRTQVPQLPAENSTYLGRSLFTDYLLPVELGGLLLLVAVVGAIAIAQRTSPERNARP